MSKSQAKRIADALEGRPDLLSEVLQELENRKIGNDPDKGYCRGFHHSIAQQVATWAAHYHLRTDWHEPDEQDTYATVFGTRLDNACGNHVSQQALDGGHQELVVELTHQEYDAKGVLGGSDNALKVNLADLFAIVTRYYQEHVRPGGPDES